MKKFKKAMAPLHAFGFAICLSSSASLHAQQTIANPLIRPASSQGLAAQGQQTVATDSSGGGQAAQSEELLRRQAERRVTQEDLNIRQQALNTPVVPAQLASYFNNMQVTALLRDYRFSASVCWCRSACRVVFCEIRWALHRQHQHLGRQLRHGHSHCECRPSQGNHHCQRRH